MRYHGDVDMDEDDEYTAEWREPYSDSLDGSEEGDPSEVPFSTRSVKAMSQEEEE